MTTLRHCILQENEKLTSLNMELNDNFKTLHENQLCEKSVLQCKLTEMQNEISSLKTECSNLQSKLYNEQTSYKEIETEYLEFKEMTFRSIDKEREHYEHFTQRHSKEVRELKTEIKHLKSKLASAESNATAGANNISTTKQTSAHQGGGTKARTTSVENNQSRPTFHGNSSVPGCRKCGSTVPHPPRQCPARNFVCEGCQKQGHHTINCFHSCRDCGARKALCNMQNCTAKALNCAYCGVKGHLSHVCLQRR